MNTTTTTTSVTFELDAESSRRLSGSLERVAAAACTDKLLPVLCAVKTVAETGKVSFSATDRYVAATDTFAADITATTPVSTLISTDGIKELVRVLKRNKGWAKVTISAEAIELVTADNGARRWMAVDGEFPRLGPLFTGVADAVASGAHSATFPVLSGVVLASIAKVFGGRNHPGMVMRQAAEGKGVLITSAGSEDTLTMLAMPLRRPTELPIPDLSHLN